MPEGDLFSWDPKSTYVKHPPYFEDMSRSRSRCTDINGARVLAVLGDSITTDHISPAGSIKPNGPAGKYLIEHGVAAQDFNSYGSRRGNDEVMVRGTFANVRLKNQLAPGTEGGVTRHLPDGEAMSIFDASVQYKKEGVPLVILAGKEYGSGSSRDWAAKGPHAARRARRDRRELRAHPPQQPGRHGHPAAAVPAGRERRQSLGLTGEEVYDLEGLPALLNSNLPTARRSRCVQRRERREDVPAVVRIDTPQEVRYYQHGGILQYVLRQLLAAK